LVYWVLIQDKAYTIIPKKPNTTKIKIKIDTIITCLPLFYRLYDFCLINNFAIVVPNILLSQVLYFYLFLSIILHKKIEVEKITYYIGKANMKTQS